MFQLLSPLRLKPPRAVEGDAAAPAAPAVPSPVRQRDARPSDGDGEGQYFRWRNGHDDLPEEDETVWSAYYPLRVNGSKLGRLQVRKFTNGRPLQPDIPATLHLLSKAMAINLERVIVSTRAPAE